MCARWRENIQIMPKNYISVIFKRYVKLEIITLIQVINFIYVSLCDVFIYKRNKKKTQILFFSQHSFRHYRKKKTTKSKKQKSKKHITNTELLTQSKQHNLHKKKTL